MAEVKKTRASQIRANMNWNKKNKDRFRNFHFSLKKDEDSKIIKFLESLENRTIFIKNLILKEMERREK